MCHFLQLLWFQMRNLLPSQVFSFKSGVLFLGSQDLLFVLSFQKFKMSLGMDFSGFILLGSTQLPESCHLGFLNIQSEHVDTSCSHAPQS